MKQVYLLFLTALLSQTTPLLAMDDLATQEIVHTSRMRFAKEKIINLQRDIIEQQQRLKDLDQYIGQYPQAKGSVVILGPSGGGKTSLVYLLAHKLLEAKRVPLRGIRLHETEPMDGFKIGHTGLAGTSFPSVYYDNTLNRNRFIIDCPGFGDPEGAEKDIKHALSIQHLLMKRGLIKVVLTLEEKDVVGRTTEFKKLLNDITEVFQDDESLYEGLSCVITNQFDTRSEEFSLLLKEILQEQEKLSENSCGLSKRSRHLLSFLAIHPERISSIPKATTEGSFNFDVTSLQKMIENTDYITSPKVKLYLGQDAKLLAKDVGAELNDFLVTYMATKGAQDFINFCQDRIDTHRTSIADLRGFFRKVATKIKSLQKIEVNSPMDFVAKLEKFIPIEEISQAIGLLDFIQSIQSDIANDVARWANAFGPLIDQIEDLTVVPQEIVKEGKVYLKTVLTGSSEIQALCQKYPNLPLYVQAWGTLLMDDNITHQGQDLVLMVPSIKAWKTITVDLSGLTGIHGRDGDAFRANGQPGGLGKNAGNFYLKMHHFEGQNYLTVNANGGNGGNGGNGSDGAPGANGQIPEKGIVDTSTRQWKPTNYNSGIVTYKHFKYYVKGDFHTEYYVSLGLPGQDGGQGGIGGRGGYGGVIWINGIQQNPYPISGNQGQNGNGGRGGQGGVHQYWSQYVNTARCDGRYDQGVFNSHTNHPNLKLHDSVISPQGPRPNVDLIQAEPGKNANGLNNHGLQNAVPSAPLDEDIIKQEYNEDYEKIKEDPNTNALMRDFPNL